MMIPADPPEPTEEEMRAIVVKVDAKMRDYSSKVHPDLKKRLASELEPYRDCLHRLSRFYLWCCFLADEGRLKVAFDEEASVMATFGRVAHGMLGVRACLQAGNQIDAAGIVRGIFETSVNMRLMCQQDYRERVTLFHNYRYIQQHENLEQHRARVQKGTETLEDFQKIHNDKRVAEVEKNYARVKDDYGPGRHWAWKFMKDTQGRVSFWSICKHLDMVDEYNTTFSTMSIPVHGGPLVSNLFQNEKGLHLKPQFSSTHRPISGLAIGFAAHFVELLLKQKIDANDDAIWFTKWLSFQS